VLWAAQGYPVSRIAEIGFTSLDRVREVINNFNQDGFEALYPTYRGGRPQKFPPETRAEVARTGVGLACTPAYASWLNPIECQLGELDTFVIEGSDFADHAEATQAINALGRLHWCRTGAQRPATARYQSSPVGSRSSAWRR
jgi:hypothetical protein